MVVEKTQDKSTEPVKSSTALTTTADGIAYARPRPDPGFLESSRPRFRRVSGGHLRVEVAL